MMSLLPSYIQMSEKEAKEMLGGQYPVLKKGWADNQVADYFPIIKYNFCIVSFGQRGIQKLFLARCDVHWECLTKTWGSDWGPGNMDLI